MKRRITTYGILAFVSLSFIIYSLVNHYMIDPGAETFLSHKTGLTRELKLPAWLTVMYIHVAFACIAMAAGLLNFSKRLFASNRKLHRINGYIYLISVAIVILTSGYMAPYATGGKVTSMGFNAINIIWMIITIIAFVQIRRKRVTQHRHWMIRSYAFCFTNMLIHLITTLMSQVFGYAYAASYTIGVYGTIALLLIIPGIIIRNVRPKSRSHRHTVA